MVGEGQDRLDTRALELATTAVTKIDEHLKQHQSMDETNRLDRAALRQQMAEFHNETSSSFRRLHERVDAMSGRWLGAATALIALLLGVIGFLLVNGPPWPMVAAWLA